MEQNEPWDGNLKKQETTEIQVSLTMGILFGFLVWTVSSNSEFKYEVQDFY